MCQPEPLNTNSRALSKPGALAQVLPVPPPSWPLAVSWAHRSRVLTRQEHVPVEAEVTRADRPTLWSFKGTRMALLANAARHRQGFLVTLSSAKYHIYPFLKQPQETPPSPWAAPLNAYVHFGDEELVNKYLYSDIPCNFPTPFLRAEFAFT